MKELTCIICPRGCHLKIDDHLNVTGNNCIRGEKYAKEELTRPMRTITSFVRVKNRQCLVCPIKTSGSIPKDKIFDVMKEIEKIGIDAPVKVGDILLKNILNLNVDVVATKNIK